jgi:hypothetical protein
MEAALPGVLGAAGSSGAMRVQYILPSVTWIWSHGIRGPVSFSTLFEFCEMCATRLE